MLLAHHRSYHYAIVCYGVVLASKVHDGNYVHIIVLTTTAL